MKRSNQDEIKFTENNRITENNLFDAKIQLKYDKFLYIIFNFLNISTDYRVLLRLIIITVFYRSRQITIFI